MIMRISIMNTMNMMTMEANMRITIIITTRIKKTPNMILKTEIMLMMEMKIDVKTEKKSNMSLQLRGNLSAFEGVSFL